MKEKGKENGAAGKQACEPPPPPQMAEASEVTGRQRYSGTEKQKPCDQLTERGTPLK